MPYSPPVYPTAIPTLTDLPDRVDGVDWVDAARYNELKKELRAALAELGTLPKGASADVKTRLGLLALKSNVLELDNTTVYTPTANYHPATKKYVDDAAPTIFTDRGDPAAADWTKDTLTADGAFHDLDLSSIVPAGAKAVLISITVKDDAAGSRVLLRKNGNSNSWNVGVATTQVANLRHFEDVVIPCDTNRVIEYELTNTVWTEIYFLIKGWWF